MAIQPLQSNNMKINLLIMMIVAISLTACKKNSTTPSTPITSSPYYAKANINGTNVLYSNYVGAVNKASGLLYIYGYSGDAIATTDGITLIIHNSGNGTDNQPIVIGNYTDTANFQNGLYNYWNPYSASITLQQSGTDYANSNQTDYDNSTPFTCIITAIDSSSVSGTFSGILYYEFGSTTKTITNGSFYVSF
jgi:hypothetical protein